MESGLNNVVATDNIRTKEGDVIDTKARMLGDEGISLILGPKGYAITAKELTARLWAKEE